MALIDNIVSYWKFDESSGNATDSHGSNTLTNNNSTAYTTGKINNGADLEASSSQVFSITDAAQSGLDITGSLSISMWINPESITGTHGLVTKFQDTAGGKGYRLSFDTTDVAWVISNNGSIESVATWTSPLSTGSLQHIVLAYNAPAGSAIVYHNNTSLGTVSGLATSIQNVSAVFRVGSRSSSLDAAQQFFDGVIDEVGIWNKTLSSGEVTQLYNSGSGFAYPFANTYSLSMDTGAYTLTGNDVALQRSAAGWSALAKNSSTFAAQSKNSSTWSSATKSSSTWSSTTKS